MDDFRKELRIITNNKEWTVNEKFEAIDELHEKHIAIQVKLFAIPVVIDTVCVCNEPNPDGVFGIYCQKCGKEIYVKKQTGL